MRVCKIELADRIKEILNIKTLDGKISIAFKNDFCTHTMTDSYQVLVYNVDVAGYERLCKTLSYENVELIFVEDGLLG